ncbi:hypothetical protein [Arthrobacter pascens]|uniref:hypothetical protein n=1 Tax=Arthrobacter pascens TaxID=1677 RepID=UPI00196ACF0D|nr:hypothetical protein [Arthrobacter pascens]MBN3496045.1 hypothetical protein [Arthrobacter pascens]
MTTQEEFAATAGEDLSPGDVVEARRGGRLLHRGTVTDVAHNQGLLWIMDTLTGGRRLLDHSELEITRAPALELPADVPPPFPVAG